MNTILPFVPKIVERTVSQVKIHNTLVDYHRDKLTHLTSKTPHFLCVCCENTYRNKAEAEKEECVRVRTLPDYTYNRHRQKNSFNWNFYSKTINVLDVRQSHVLKDVTRVTNELGDDIGFHGNGGNHRVERKARDYRPTMEYFLLNSWCSPELRGILPKFRPGREWARKHKHYPDFMLDGWGHKKSKVAQERRMYDACLVDEHSPVIRGKRSKRKLEAFRDESYAHRERTWKVKKVKKQWMTNLI